MNPPRRPKPPQTLRSRPMTLGQACREAGLDAHGMRCPPCPLKVLCVTETRWRVRREQRTTGTPLS